MDHQCFTVSEFCEAHRISKAGFYELVKNGRGPRLMRIGRKPLVSVEAAAEWRRTMECAPISAPISNAR